MSRILGSSRPAGNGNFAKRPLVSRPTADVSFTNREWLKAISDTGDMPLPAHTIPAPAGVEVAFGMVNDAQFGPVVMVSAGESAVLAPVPR